TNNVATSNGGVIYTTVYLNITGGVMNGNNAVYGGAIYNTGSLILNGVTLTNNNAQILSIALEAPNSVQDGNPLIVTSYLISGNNAANAIYSKSDFVYIDGDEVKLSDKPVNKTITLNIDNVIHTRVTDSNGLAIFNFNIVIIGDLKISRLEVGFTEAGLSVSRVKNLAIMGREDISPLPESKGKTNKINSASKSKPSTKNALTKSNAKNLSKAKANAFIKSKKSSSSTKSKTIMQAYDYRNKKMVWFNVKNSATIKSYPAGLRNVITTTTTKVRYIVTTNTKNSNRYNSKTNTNTSVKYSVLYDIKGSKSKVVKVTTIISKQSTKKLANEYLQQSTNAEVNNPRIAALAKQITKGVKSDDYYTKAKLIYKWVQENIDYTLNADISAVDILSKKGSNGNYKAFCVGFSNVMAALCRSEGIPVQYHAIFFFEKEAYPFEGHSGHVYSKVYVNGKWLFADAATVGFTAPLNYKGYLQEMKTQPGGSYYTATNNWDYWNFVCNHHLVSHSDSHITKEAEGVPVLEYFNLSIKTTVNTVTAAYNVLNPYATANGYLISKNYYFSAFTNRVDSNNYISVWAFHYFDNSDNFLGYMLISQNGILFPVLETSTWVDPGDNGWEV
ncbi:MAG: transglutaminase-like domain-containing protein, partial [Methanobrevibacter sp.]|nr:transglutaminase-like domain-containing protein [Methanobrevibacter sp.]